MTLSWKGGNTKISTITHFLVNALAVFREIFRTGNGNPCHEKSPFSGECLTWAASWNQIAHTHNIRNLTTKDNEKALFDWRQYPISRKSPTIDLRVPEEYRRLPYKLVYRKYKKPFRYQVKRCGRSASQCAVPSVLVRCGPLRGPTWSPARPDLTDERACFKG